MSINKMISMQNAIIDAMELCGTDHDKDKMVFQRWGELAEKEIGSRYQFIKKIAVLDIHNCSACLPDDAFAIQRALLGDYGCDCTDLFYKWCGSMSFEGTTLSTGAVTEIGSFLVVDVGTGATMWDNVVGCEVQNNKLVFYNNYDGQKVTVQYIAYDTDCDGFLKIGQNHVRAITYYICWMYFLRKKRKSNDDFYMANKFEALWQQECPNARGQDSVMTESQRDKIVAILHDPMVGIGLQLGMTTTRGGYWY